MKRLACFLGFMLFVSVSFANVILAKPRVHVIDSECQMNWTQVPIPDVGTLNTIKVIAANDFWAGGVGDWLHWDGKEWNVIPRPIGGDVYEFVATSSEDVWAIGSIPTAPAQSFILHWDGQAWTKSLQVERDGLLGGVAFAPDSVWAVGVRGWRWDGQAWTEAPSPYVAYEIAGTSSDDMWAVGSNGTHILSPFAWHWDGTKWSEPYAFTGFAPWAGLYGISMLSKSDVWVVGASYGDSLTAHWDGNGWTEIEAPGIILEDVVALASDNVYAAGDNIVHWDGVAWKEVWKGQTASFYGVDAVSAEQILAVGYTREADSSEHSLMMQGALSCVEPTITPEPTPTKTPTDSACLQAPKIQLPEKNALLTTNNVFLKWGKVDCATHYRVVVKQNSERGARAFNGKVKKHKLTTPALEAKHTYYWRVRGCKPSVCGKWSKWRQFTIQ